MKHTSFLCLFFIFILVNVGFTQDEDQFLNPPDEVKPKTWMHAMSGNMSKEGLTKDLESMSEVGIGGLLLFNVSQGIPNGPIIYNSTEHHEMLTHAAVEAERLGLSFGVHNCDGWSSSGGPWVKAEESMKMLVHSETIVEGGIVNMKLSQPTTREGFYKDIATYAYPSFPSEVDDQENQASIKSSDDGFNTPIINDGRIDQTVSLSSGKNDKPWIMYTYDRAKTIRSVQMWFEDRHGEATLQTSVDGENWIDRQELFKVRTGKGEWGINDHFEGYTSRYFRLLFSQAMSLKEVNMTSTYLINNPLGRLGIARTEDVALDPIGNPARDMLIQKADIVDLTDDISEVGILKTTLPEGQWTILRFGYTSTGAFNNPASHEGKGLEVDKLSRPPFKKHYDEFVKRVIINTKSKAPNALQYVEIDSYEMGGQNWTEGFAETFKSRFGYDLMSFFPLLAGRFVENPKTSEAVLYDFRRLISDLMTKNYFHYFTELLHEDGLKSYIEPYGFGPLNDLDIVANTDLPMGEFWMNRPITQVKSPVSGAHIYGKNVISAESFTSDPSINWKGNPAMAKNSGDLAWTQGINEFMFHRFAHQANVHAEPGMTMNRWGFHFDRTQTWWTNAGKDWFRYIARGSYLLREGFPVSDFAVFIGDGSPNSSYRRDQLDPEVPKTLNFDCINADVLKNRSYIVDKELFLPEGISYKAILLKNSETMELATLQSLYDLSKLGLPLYGKVPSELAGYGHSKADQTHFIKLAKALKEKIKPLITWDSFTKDLNITPDFKVKNRPDIDFVHRKCEEADIYFFYNPDSIASTFLVDFRIANMIPEQWDPMSGIVKDVGKFKSNGSITTIGIDLDAGESTFLVFRKHTQTRATLAPESNIDAYITESDQLKAIFKQNGKHHITYANSQTIHKAVEGIPENIDLKNEWKLNLDGTEYDFSALTDWSLHPNENIKYFSGTASYSTTFEVPSTAIADGTKAFISLGEVKIVAEVIINGQSVGVDWIPPFLLDITGYLKVGTNDLNVKVTNQWSNKLIGDERFPAKDGGYKLGPHRANDLTMPVWYTNNEPRPTGKRTTFTTAPFYAKDDPLMPSGLMGPVVINFQKEMNIGHDFLPQVNMPNGRIAFSSDGNLHDSDDWGATAMSLALLHYAGLVDRFVHYDYNNHIGNSRASWEKIMDDAAKGGAQRFGLDVKKVFNDQTERKEALINFVKEANKSTKQDPLWFICAGPMHAASEMIAKTDPAAHPNIHLISHGEWNENHSHGETAKTWADLQKDFPKLRFHEIIDQNKSNGDKDFHSHMSNWYWLKDGDNPDWQWLYDIDDTWQVDSLENWKSDTKEQYDVSDAGMTYWLISGGPKTGNARAGWPEAKALFEGKPMLSSANPRDILNDDDYLIIEAESTTSDLGEWKLVKESDHYYIANASGGGHLEFQGNDPDNGPPTSPISYEFKAPRKGNFRLLMMTSKRLEGARGDLCNDGYVKMDGDFSSATTLNKAELSEFQKYFQEGSTKTPELSWQWGIRAEKGSHQFHNIIYKMKAGETYTLTLAGRSQRFSVDYFVLYDAEKFELKEAQELFRK